MGKVLEIINLSAGYGSQTVIHNVNLTVNALDFVGIIGPNGGGKTTLIKCIAGLLKPMSGEIRISGNGQTRQAGGIGYLPQVNSFDKRFPISVKEVILSGLLSRKALFAPYSHDDHKEALAIMEKLHITHLAGKNIGALSGGQMQRVFLGRALISKPVLLLLDEPSTFADNRFEAELYEILAGLNDELTILMVSHDLGIIPAYVKSIACVNGELHYHPGPSITPDILKVYNCPIELIAHGNVPHRVLHTHHENTGEHEHH
jgi:zinc transport system ATP-binding protein